MNRLEVSPGNVIVTNFFGYQHWSLASDRFCRDGFPMLISATKRNGTVQEESWEMVTKGNDSYVANINTHIPVSEILRNARDQIGQWKYCLTSNNCEHFVKSCTNLEVTSTQVKAGIGGAVLGSVAVGAMAENPNLVKFLGGSLLVGGLAILLTRPSKK